jgi:hypothetical protein
MNAGTRIPGQGSGEAEGKRLAITAQVLFLLNLLFPLLPLLALMLLTQFHPQRRLPLVRNHLRQGLAGAVASSLVFVAANLVIIAQGGYRSMTALVAFELYYLLAVPLFLVPGLLGILRAMAGREFRFPLLGRWF